MKKIIFLILLSFGGIFTLTAQDTTLIYGKWKFVDATEKEKSKLDSTGLKMLNMFFGDLDIFFNKDGRYELNFMSQPDLGFWRWSDNLKGVTLVSDKGESKEVGIVILSDSNMEMTLAKGAFVMRKVEVTVSDIDKTAPRKIEGVSATISQVAKKWYLKSRVGDHPSKYREEVDKMLSRDLYMKLHKNGRFEAEVLIVQDEARWSFGVDNKSIIISSQEGKKIWNIVSISENEMVLRRGISDEVWTFITKLF